MNNQQKYQKNPFDIKLNDPEVNIYTREILYWMIDSGNAEYSTSEVAVAFNISSIEASKRIMKLRQWGMVKIAKRKRPWRFEVTKWGRKFATDNR